MCIVCSKVNFITNITNSTRIHIFYFYNNKTHIYQYGYNIYHTTHKFYKNQYGSMTGPKCSPLNPLYDITLTEQLC